MARANDDVTSTPLLPTPTFDGEGHQRCDTHKADALPTPTGGQAICDNQWMVAARTFDGSGQEGSGIHPTRAEPTNTSGHRTRDTQSVSAAGNLDGCGHRRSDAHGGLAATTCEEGEGQRRRDTHSTAALSLLNTYVSTYEAAQKMRLETMNRIRCWLRDTHPADEWGENDYSDKVILAADYLPNDLRDAVAHVTMLEKAAARGMRREIRKHPLWPWLEGVRGMGEVLAARLLHRVGDIYRFPSPAHLWSYCGLDGPGWKQKPHSWPLTSICYNIAESFQKQPTLSGGYRDIYDARKQYEAAKDWCGNCRPKGSTEPREICTPAHINNKARRYTVKVFLKDLWRFAHGYTVLQDEEAAT